MARTLAKSPSVLLALGFWILACAALRAEDDDPYRLDLLVSQLVEQGKYKEAIPIAQRALEATKSAWGQEHFVTAACLTTLGSLFMKIDEYDKAEPLLQEALRIRQKVLGVENPDTVESLNELGYLYKEWGEYDKAEPLFLEALRIRQKVLGQEHLKTAASLNSLGELYWRMAEYDKAEPLFLETLRIRQKVLGSESPDTAESLNNLGMLYTNMGNYDKAEPLLKEAFRIRKKVLGSENMATGDSLNDLGSLYFDKRDYTTAEPLFQEALQICQKVLGIEDPYTVVTFSNLATLYEAIGDYDGAESLYQKVLQVCRKVLGPEHPFTAHALNNLGELYHVMGDCDKAEPLLREALQIRQKVLGPENADTADALSNLSFLEFDRGRMDEATVLARETSAVQLKIVSKMFSFTSEEQRLAYLDGFNQYSLLIALKGTETDLAEEILRYKGVVLDSIIEDRLLAEARDGSQDQKQVEELDMDKRQLGQLYLQSAQKLSVETTQRINLLEGEVEQIQSQLAQHVAGLGQARRALGVHLEQVQAAIPNDGALIEYLRYSHYLGRNQWEKRYGAILLFSKGAPIWIPLGKAKEIEALVRRYGTLIRDSPEDDEISANLQALYEALWAPIGQALPNQTKKIIISPDGQLNFISFATLLSEDKQFLAQIYDVQYVVSGRDLLRQSKPSLAKEVVLFANPDFNLALTPMLTNAVNGSPAPTQKLIGRGGRRDIEDWSFGSLEGTQKERDELIKVFAGWDWKPKDFTKKMATKEELLKIHSPYILHLATHGFFAKEDPATTQTDAFLNGRQSVTRSKFFTNPMHRSGLALAGAQSTIEAWKHGEVPPVENDGILTAEDVSTLDLQGTWLVTLSACDTGSGEARAGEGVMGLRRGFIQAGAQNLLLTLWPISDEITVQIMSDFYKSAHDTENAAEALAEVQRKWLLKLRAEKGLAQAVNLAGPFIISSQGKP
jgi:tetratricopeptide (TPR) repeat protein